MLPPDAYFPTIMWSILAAGVIASVVLVWINAPYGRHNRPGWGPTVPHLFGWVVMESPAVIVFAAVYLAGDHRADAFPLVCLALWQIHYLNRTVVFPFRVKSKGKRMPVLIMVISTMCNVCNAYINARWVSHLGEYGPQWMAGAPFLIGIGLFIVGAAINHHSDHILFNLRKPGETGYVIPRGGLYRYVSAPNYLGELVEWLGWAILTWSTAGLVFALFTACNLVPRAVAHHRWYIETFPDYPTERAAIIPRIL